MFCSIVTTIMLIFFNDEYKFVTLCNVWLGICGNRGKIVSILWFCIVNAVQNFYNKNIKYLGVKFIWNN